MTQLTTLAKVHRLGKFTVDGTLQTADDVLIEDELIPLASAMIENHCEVTFSATNGTLNLDAAPPYLYDDTLFFRLNDMLGVDVVFTDVGTLQPGDYDLLPLQGAPYYGLRLRSGQWQYSNWRNAIKVGGTLGYSTTVPPDISGVATRLAWWLYQNRDNDGSVYVAEGVAQIPGDAPKFIFKTLEKYVKVLTFG